MRKTADGSTIVTQDPLQVWGGLECSVVRIGDRWRDQFHETGHFKRPKDLDRVAALGIRVLRYPVLWEHVAPHHPDLRHWEWHDRRLERLRHLGLMPIVGLLHHGSGPHYTDLLDPRFPEQLALYAGAVAARYPWVRHWTPVNEPLTTARFSGLYGHWYPHARNEDAFLLMLFNQCRGVLLAMRAIRQSVPDANLVQTEDLARTFATPSLAYQADYENSRRWLSFDLLTGRIDKRHPWWDRLLRAGIPAGHLEEFLSAEAAPDIIGVNHYATSDRYLDDRITHYPAHLHGGNGRDRYADIEAVRAMPSGMVGWAARLREAWSRYRRPIVLTEVHLGDHEEEQVRWLIEAWQAARDLRATGADVRAVTIWALIGAIDWNSLLRHVTGHYEAGCFDCRCDPPRPTLLSKAVKALAYSGRFEHPALDEDGWWLREDRFHPACRGQDSPKSAHASGCV